MTWKSKKPDHHLTPWLFFGELSQITQDYVLNQFQLVEDCQGRSPTNTFSQPGHLSLHGFWINIDLFDVTKLGRDEKEHESKVNSKTM